MTNSLCTHAIDMSNDELLILSLLKDRPREKAILNSEIQTKTDIPERRIRRIVQQLIIMYRQPIGSSTSSPQGYYWIKNIDEADRNYRRLRSRALVILKRAAMIKGIATEDLINQLKLDLTGEQHTTNNYC